MSSGELIRSVRVTKEMLGIHTRKKILYLDQHFLSSVYRGNNPQFAGAMQRITEVLDLQLLAVPYSSTHEAEADFWQERDSFIRFMQRLSRGHHFEPHYRVEATQILKAFQAYLANAPASYLKEEQDALSSRVHEWDDTYSVSVFRPAHAVARKRMFKQQALKELVNTLGKWAASQSTFEQDMELEFRDSARILIEEYVEKTARLGMGDFAALLNSPVSASIMEDMMLVLSINERLGEAAQQIPAFFKSKHFTEVPSPQLSARLFSTFKKRVREGAYPNPKKAAERLSGFLFDIQHAATYVPYCQAFFADRFLADLLTDRLVDAEGRFGCKVFSVSSIASFFSWLDGVKSCMTEEHADGLAWVYPKYRGS